MSASVALPTRRAGTGDGSTGEAQAPREAQEGGETAAAAGTSGSAGRRGEQLSGAARTDVRLTTALVVLLVVTQRLGVTLGAAQISVAIPLAYAYAGLMLYRRRLVLGRLRTELLGLAVAACLVTTAAVGITGHEYSLPSLLLLIVIYLPWLLRAPAPLGAQLVRAAANALVGTMLVVSVVGIARLAGQLLGVWTYTDYLGAVVPSQFVISGYNTANELSYGSGTIKANGFVFLEPSLLSQFAALAVLVGLMLRLSAWRLLVLVGGLASAVSGTGMILLGVGGVLLVARSPRRLRPGHVVALAVSGVAVLASPVATVLLSRRDEFTQPGSSGYARFVEPYTAAWQGLITHPVRFLMGAGPGTSSTLLPGRHNGLGNDVLYTSIPKLVFEYGLVAGGLVVAFLVVANLDGAPWRVVPGSLLVMTFVLSGALLQPQTAYLVWLLTGIGAVEQACRPPRTGAATRRRPWRRGGR